jgi:hypothetical protein
MSADLGYWIGRQPGGQVILSRIGFEAEGRNGLKGNLSRYCGRPGKKQMKKSSRKATV